MEAQELMKVVDAKVRETMKFAESTYKRKFKTPTIEYTVKGVVAGYADYLTWTVNLNLFYLLNEHENMIEDTIPHEIAHLIAFRVYGRIKPHGWQWQSVMRSFGLDPVRCHEYEDKDVRTGIRRTRQFTYTCLCSQPVTCGLNVHNKIQKGRNHFCRKCRSKMKNCKWSEK